MQVLQPSFQQNQQPVVNQQSDQRKQLQSKPVLSKKKIIRKKNKSKTKPAQIVEHSTVEEVKSTPSMAPFGIFQSQTQKCQRLEHYLRKDIENFYKISIQPHDLEILDSLLNYNLIQLTDVYHKDLSLIWKEKQSFLSQIASYLHIIQEVNKNNGNFNIIFQEYTKKYYICFQKSNLEMQLYQISQVEANLLQKRQSFFKLLRNSQQALSNKQNGVKHTKISELSTQIGFLFKLLYDSTKFLRTKIQVLKQNIQKMTKVSPIYDPPSLTQNKYFGYLVRKLVLIALKDEQIDYFNFFKNNELAQHNNGPPQANITDQKQFEQFMKKKKNKKGKKGKYVLHTACLGCCSSYYQQYNPFSYCQQCFVRFHRSCYTGYPSKQEPTYLNPRQQKDVLCEMCYHKKVIPNFKHKGNQCDYCGIKGLLSIPVGQYKRIHVFCMLLNGLWTTNNSKIEYRLRPDNKMMASEHLRCVHCNSGNGYLNYCQVCQKYAHPSCAYFHGWKIQGTYNQNTQNISLKMQCCNGIPTAQNQKRRKFITNYKKQAYSF